MKKQKTVKQVTKPKPAVDADERRLWQIVKMILPSGEMEYRAYPEGTCEIFTSLSFKGLLSRIAEVQCDTSPKNSLRFVEFCDECDGVVDNTFLTSIHQCLCDK